MSNCEEKVSKIKDKINDRINYLKQFREKVYLDYEIGTYYEDYVYKDAIKELEDLKEFINNFDVEE